MGVHPGGTDRAEDRHRGPQGEHRHQRRQREQDTANLKKGRYDEFMDSVFKVDHSCQPAYETASKKSKTYPVCL